MCIVASHKKGSNQCRNYQNMLHLKFGSGRKKTMINRFSNINRPISGATSDKVLTQRRSPHSALFTWHTQW